MPRNNNNYYGNSAFMPVVGNLGYDPNNTSTVVAVRRPRARRARRRPQRVRTVRTVRNRRPRRRRQRGVQRASKSTSIMNRLSLHGRSFLEDSFAPPDFQISKTFGIPDAFAGNVLVKQHFFSGSFITGSSIQDTVILVMPIPGCAFAIDTNWPSGLVNPGGLQTFTTVGFNDSAITFPATQETDMLVKYRYQSMCVEIIPVGSPLTTSGTMSVNKFPLSYSINSGKMSGDGAVGTLFNRAPYVQPLLAGAYSVSTHKDPSWEFKDIEAQWGVLNPGLSTGMGTIDTGYFNVQFNTGVGDLRPSFTGFGDMDTIALRISGTGTNQPHNIRVWSTVEYQVNPSGPLIDYVVSSPQHDPLALECYKEMAQLIPYAVPHAQNASFWKTLLGLLSGGLGLVGAAVTGPWGAIAGGASLIAGGIGSFFSD